MIACDRNGVVVSFAGVEDIVVGQHATDVFPEAAEMICRCLDGAAFEVRLLRQERLMELRGLPTPTGFFLTLEPAGPIAADAFEFIVANMRQGLWRLDASGHIVYANPYLAQWLETTVAELLGRQAVEFLITPEGSDRFEAEFVTPSGLQRRAIVTRQPLQSGQGVIDLITDVTAEHALRTKLVEEAQTMARLAKTDPLTGLPNRRAFDDALKQLCTAEPTPEFAVVIIDCDGFKAVNDALGHPIGDEALIQFSQRIRAVVRESDMVARLGGDEFVVLLPNAPVQVAQEVVRRLEDRLQVDLLIEGQPVSIGGSIGMAHSSDGVEAILHVADRRMYRQKRKRKAR